MRHTEGGNCPTKKGVCVAVSGFACLASKKLILPQIMITHHDSMVFFGGSHAVGIEKWEPEMHEFVQIILGVIFLAIVYILTRYGIANRIRRTATLIMQDLERREAFDPGSAVDLPYAQTHYFRFGLRDYRPKALGSLVQGGFVGKTETGKYYLKERGATRPVE
jgi:hypothetical protein